MSHIQEVRRAARVASQGTARRFPPGTVPAALILAGALLSLLVLLAVLVCSVVAA